jgi:hypothetical protein
LDGSLVLEAKELDSLSSEFLSVNASEEPCLVKHAFPMASCWNLLIIFLTFDHFLKFKLFFIRGKIQFGVRGEKSRLVDFLYGIGHAGN